MPAGLREGDVADLLECLIQIGALEHSIERIGRFVAAAPPAARVQVETLVARLAAAEQTHARVGLGRTDTSESSASTPALAAFIADRLANLDVLRACTAAELGRPVAWPGRPGTTVADLVAIMLARDTEVLGELRLLTTRQSRPE